MLWWCQFLTVVGMKLSKIARNNGHNRGHNRNDVFCALISVPASTVTYTARSLYVSVACKFLAATARFTLELRKFHEHCAGVCLI